MAYQSDYTGKQIDIMKNTGFLALISPTVVNYILANTYYPITGTFSDGGESRNFVDNGDGTITYIGEDGNVVVTGSSDSALGGTTSAEVVFGLYRNGALVPGAETPHDFGTFNQTQTFSIAALIPISNGDVFSVYTRCDDDGRTLSISTLRVTFECK